MSDHPTLPPSAEERTGATKQADTTLPSEDPSLPQADPSLDRPSDTGAGSSGVFIRLAVVLLVVFLALLVAWFVAFRPA